MNNLVSKSPVLRFKLGKIIKAQFGTNKIKIGADVPKIDYLIPLYDLGIILKISSIPSIPARPYPYKGPIVKIGILKVPNISPSATPTNLYLTQGSTKGGMLKEYEENLIKTLASEKPKSKNQSTNNIFIKKFLNRRNEIKDVKSILKKLIKLGLLKDRFGADGKWGKNTEVAYQKYLQMLNIPIYEKPETSSVAEMAGIYSTENNTDLNQPLYLRIRFKQGGQLILKNLIEKFKRQNIK